MRADEAAPTDELHPHVHMVLKAVSEQGERLHIRKATLRHWRSGFARHLRELGVAANATERAVRGQTRTHKLDGIYRAGLRGESTHMRDKAESVARELGEGGLRAERGKSELRATRIEVQRAWQAVSDILVRQQQPELAEQVKQFANRMPPPMTECEVIANAVRVRARNGPERAETVHR